MSSLMVPCSTSAWILQKADMFSVLRDAGSTKDEEAKRGAARRGEASTAQIGCGIHIQKVPLSFFLFPLSSLPFALSLFPFPKLEMRWRNATSQTDAGSDEDWEDGGRLTCGSMPEPEAPVAREYVKVASTGSNKTFWIIFFLNAEKEVYKVLLKYST